MKRMAVLALALAASGSLGACDNAPEGTRGAVVGGAMGAGVGMLTRLSFPAVAGAALVGGAVGYILDAGTSKR